MTKLVSAKPRTVIGNKVRQVLWFTSELRLSGNLATLHNALVSNSQQTVSECVAFNVPRDTFQRRVFPGNWLHWYWQPLIMTDKNHIISNYILPLYSSTTVILTLSNACIFHILQICKRFLVFVIPFHFCWPDYQIIWAYALFWQCKQMLGWH